MNFLLILIKYLKKLNDFNHFLKKALNLIFNAKFSNNEVLQVTDHYSPHLNLEVNNMNESENNNNCDTLLNLPFNIFIMILVDMWKRIKEYKNVKYLLFFLKFLHFLPLFFLNFNEFL